MKIGDRVGAIQKADEVTIYLFGYGVYDGEFRPDVPIAFFDDPKDLPDGFTNPRITLDNGKVVWGGQCWWGSEDEVKKMIGDRNVIYVDIP